MTVIRPEDIELHYEDGSHVEIPPGKEHRNERARLARHLARHSRGDLPELNMLGTELAEATRMREDAVKHEEAVRTYVIGVAREYIGRGVKKEEVARRLNIPARRLYDYLEYGKRM